jgi:hypothetical protein
MIQITPHAAPETSRSDWQKIAESVARNFSTEEFAAQLKVKPQTIRAGYCRDGHYLDVVPIKLSNRRLLWPADEVDALIAGRTVKADPEKIDEHFARKTADASKVLPHIRAKSEAKAKRLAAMTGEVVQ